MDKPTLPVWPGPDLSPCCWVSPGMDHNLSCNTVPAELFKAFFAWQSEQHDEEN